MFYYDRRWRFGIDRRNQHVEVGENSRKGTERRSMAIRRSNLDRRMCQTEVTRDRRTDQNRRAYV